MVVVLSLNHGQGAIGTMVENIIRAHLVAACYQLATDQNAAIGERDFFTYLCGEISFSWSDDRWGDELGADVAFAEDFFTHRIFG